MLKILLAADGSEYTRLAARYLAGFVKELAQPPEIHLLNVHAPLPFGKSAAAAAGEGNVKRYHEEECKAALSVAESVLREAGVAFQSAWAVGDVGREIDAYATKNGIGLIVMGSHGHGQLRNLALGSVTDAVLRSTKVAVTVVRA